MRVGTGNETGSIEGWGLGTRLAALRVGTGNETGSTEGWDWEPAIYAEATFLPTILLVACFFLQELKQDRAQEKLLFSMFSTFLYKICSTNTHTHTHAHTHRKHLTIASGGSPYGKRRPSISISSPKWKTDPKNTNQTGL